MIAVTPMSFEANYISVWEIWRVACGISFYIRIYWISEPNVRLIALEWNPNHFIEMAGVFCIVIKWMVYCWICNPKFTVTRIYASILHIFAWLSLCVLTHCNLLLYYFWLAPLAEVTSWWRHQMETFSALLALCAENSPVTHEGQWRGVLVFSLICAWTNGWVNNQDASDLRRNRAHYDVTVMMPQRSASHA